MKFLLLSSMLILTIACSKKNDSPKGTGLENTSWESKDYVAELIYGKNCYSTIQFANGNSMQEVRRRETSLLPGTDTYQGTYYISNDSVYWQTSNDKNLQRGKIIANYLYRNLGSLSDKYVYPKK